MSAKDLLVDTISALKTQAGKGVFAFGGKVALASSAAGESGSDADAKVLAKDPVVRWDSGEETHGRTVTLPVGESVPAQGAFSQLLKDCQPATFGLDQKAVYDETYRKAGKLSASQFATSFCPYEHGVMDAITQALVHQTSRGVRAELYNLNVYSAPSGKFRPHVDTPRSTDQMGSLVVCLPYPHKGGELAVRHESREVVFNWASESPSTVQWAAFFSDCEHEVLEVTEGHRLTMTYNLYWTSYGPAAMAGHLSALQPESFHFYAPLQKLLECPTFMPKGGVIGFKCTHAYPHTSTSAIKNLQDSLKGVDMIVYQALKSLADKVKVVSVIDRSQVQYDAEEAEARARSKTKTKTNTKDDDDSDDGTGNLNRRKEYIAECLPDILRWDWYDDDAYLDPTTVEDWSKPRTDKSRQVFHRRNVTWLNDPDFKGGSNELAVAFITYGNEPGIDTFYSAATIVAHIEPRVTETEAETSEAAETKPGEWSD